jgi:PAS domain S-box-containing protein
MATKKTATASELRLRAEEQLRNRTPSTTIPRSAAETQRLLHELQVHQIELEMQNDELRQSKAELEALQERFVNHYDFAPVGYCIVNEQGVILEANLTVAKLLGVARAELIQRPISRFIVPEDKDIYYLMKKRLVDQGEPQACELRMVYQAADSFWAHLETTIAEDESGRRVLRLVLSDINDRKRIEKELEESDRHNRELLESITDTFIALKDDMVVSHVNSAAERMFNQKRIDMVGRKLFDFFPEGRGTAFERKFTQAIKTKSAISFQIEFTIPPYKNWYDVHIYPRTTGITIYIQVVTASVEEKEKEEKLESVKQQLQKTASLGRMAGAIAHHFNNKLFAVMGYMDLAIDDLSMDDTSRPNLIIARREADKATEVSKLMLMYLGQVTGKLEHLDLSEVCRKMLPLLEVTLPKSVALTTYLLTPDLIIEANKDQIRQILANLVTNAWEAAGDAPGSIRLATRKVFPTDIPTSHRFPVDWLPENSEYACLEIQDYGCGIKDKDIEEIFSPFFSTKFAGRGLGLSVVLGLVKAHSGVITVENLSDKGCVFRVFLPISIPESVNKPEKMKHTQEVKDSGIVLLVDDDNIVLQISRIMLSSLGFTVLTATNGIEAVELFRQHSNEIRLVLSDVSMPGMDGWETLSAVKQIVPDIPVILTSGYSKDQVMQGAHLIHPEAFLGKPYSLALLRDTIRHALQNTKT